MREAIEIKSLLDESRKELHDCFDCEDGRKEQEGKITRGGFKGEFE